LKLNKNLVFTGLFVILLISCDNPPNSSEPPVYDTLFPLSYFPAYPGSYWKYVDINGDTTVSSTDSVYHLDSYQVYPDLPVNYAIVPVYDGKPVWGYSLHSESPSSSLFHEKLRPVLKTGPINTYWDIYHDHLFSTRRMLVATDTTVVIGSTSYYPTLVVMEYWLDESFFFQDTLYKRYYALDVGLIKEEIYTEDSISNIRTIVDYQINY
jgi:hypothetical protein